MRNGTPTPRISCTHNTRTIQSRTELLLIYFYVSRYSTMILYKMQALFNITPEQFRAGCFGWCASSSGGWRGWRLLRAVDRPFAQPSPSRGRELLAEMGECDGSGNWWNHTHNSFSVRLCGLYLCVGVCTDCVSGSVGWSVGILLCKNSVRTFTYAT